MKKTSLWVAALLSLVLIPLPSPAEPPPWAKAHGWRKKNDPNYVGYTGKRWEKDYGIVGGRCNTAEIGMVLGSVVGGAVGSRAASDSDRPVAIFVGAVVGAVIGAKIGQSIDDADRACMGHALELAGRSTTVVWRNQATGLSYRLTPTRNFSDAKQPCREFRTVVSSGKQDETINGTACRRSNGEWVFKS